MLQRTEHSIGIVVRTSNWLIKWGVAFETIFRKIRQSREIRGAIKTVCNQVSAPSPSCSPIYIFSVRSVSHKNIGHMEVIRELKHVLVISTGWVCPFLLQFLQGNCGCLTWRSCLSVWISVRVFIVVSLHLRLRQTLYLGICPSVHLSVCLPVTQYERIGLVYVKPQWTSLCIL